MENYQDVVNLYDQVLTRAQNECRRCEGIKEYFKPIHVSAKEKETLKCSFIERTDRNFWDYLLINFPDYRFEVMFEPGGDSNA